ncbi:MAG: alpha-glucosidase [Lachnospiraceae bacterium]|nr:alpha-glucosidase [Lachnospiraceae bacterium]
MAEQRAWWKEAVIYQIYPRSFADSNGDGIGDLRGIEAHLPYLHTLGIDVIWLSPVYQSPNDDNGYDISDYRAIMTEFGTLEDFDRMLAKAHELGIRIVMDLVVNHTSDEHAWFIESKKSKDNPYRDYYIWKDGKDGKAPNNWQSCFSGSAWQLDETTGMYYLHCFSKKQPDLNWENPKVRDEVFDMMTWWCERGIDGFRMDVISMISKDPRFPDGEVTDGIYGDLNPYVCNGPHVHEYLQEMNRRVLSKFDIMTVGEAAGVTIDEAKKYANAQGSELNMVFHFEHVGMEACGRTIIGKWGYEHPQLSKFRAIMNKWQLELEGKAWGSLYLDNHDQPRAVSHFGCDDPKWRVRSAKMLATMLHMMKGTPYIYQGEEIGMTNMHFTSINDCRDLEEINAYRQYVTEHQMISAQEMLKCFDAVARDNARTPMQWDDGPQAGFTSGTPWIPVNPNYKEINTRAALADPDSVFYYYQKLIRLRHELPIIVYGTFEPLLEEDPNVYAYRRHLGGSILTVACNWTDQMQPCDVFAEGTGKELISNYDTHREGMLQPYEAIAVLQEG